MIASVLEHIALEVNQSMRLATGLPSSDEVAVVCAPMGTDAGAAPEANDKLLVFLAGVLREPAALRNGRISGAGDRVAVSGSPVSLNLLVMVAANLGGARYPEALKLLTQAVAVFQARPVLDHRNAPGLDPRISRLTMEIEDLDVTALSNLWGVLGGQYLPSVLYRVRMITIDGPDVQSQVPVVRQTQVGVPR